MASSTTIVPASSSSSSDPISSTSNDLTISAKCYLKVIMHSLRYPHATVNGLLLMEKKKSGKQAKLVDAIPLFHSGHGLSAMVEVALNQVNEYFSKNSNYTIGGYYQANEHFHEFPHPTPTVFAERIADKILDVNSDSVLFMISNYVLATAIDDINALDTPFYMYQNVDGKWKLKNNIRNFLLEDESLLFELLQEFIFEKQYHLNIIDFDLHLENVKNDWRNPQLNAAIEQFSKSK